MKLFTLILSAAATCMALVSAAEEEPALRGSVASAVSGVPAGSIIPKHYPLFKQCDARWGKDYIYTQTVCAVGCLMSSTSMALNGHDIKVAGNAANPGVLNTWLKNHHGYEGNIMIESAVHNVNPKHVSWPADAMHTHNDLSLAKVQDYLRRGRPVIANVNQGTHFVLVTGWVHGNEAELVVNDPYFDRWTYNHNTDVVGWRLFNMTQA